MRSILQVEEMTGGYSRNKPVVHKLTFAIRPAEMVGLIGLNGAGKSTTMKHILGLMQPHSGTIRMQGKTLIEEPEQYRASYAYVPETPLLYEELTVMEHLELTAMAYGLDNKTFQNRMEALVTEFHMKDKLNSLSAHLSKGMRQKVMIMNAFLVQPPLYIIDEPFVGLDPLGIRSLLELMQKTKQAGASLLMSSHILATIENYCDRFIVLDEGRIIAMGTIAEISLMAGVPNASLEEIFFALVKGRSNEWRS